jgi:hypothetical protein
MMRELALESSQKRVGITLKGLRFRQEYKFRFVEISKMLERVDISL